MKRIDIISGVNLNMLGTREKDIYGNATLDSIYEKCINICNSNNIKAYTFQSNIEGEIVNYIHSISGISSGIIINPGAYTHYSIAIRDSFLSVDIPFIEVHLTNIYSREEFRRHSVLSDIAYGIISGFGEESYYLGIYALKKII